MIRKSKYKSKRPKKAKALSAQNESIAKSAYSAYKDDLIWDLCNECRKAKQVKEINLYLYNGGSSESLDYKKDVLDELKRKRIIQNYEITTEEEKIEDIDLEVPLDLGLDLLPSVSSEDFKKVPKESVTEVHREIVHVAVIKCDPQEVIKRLKSDFEKADQKIGKTLKKEEVEDSLERDRMLGRLLKCGGLRFGLTTGNYKYGETVGNLMPGGKQYIVLKVLMKNPNQILSYDEIKQALAPGSSTASEDDRRGISFIKRNILRSLEIERPAKNKNLIRAHKGYMIVCD